MCQTMSTLAKADERSLAAALWMRASMGACLKATTLHYQALLDLPNTRDVISHTRFCLTFPHTAE